jgi:hypothetical protein
MSETPAKNPEAVATLQLRRQRVGLMIFGVALTIGIIAAVVGLQTTADRTAEADDLFTGLAAYVQQHDGAMPTSPEAFRQSDFIEQLPDGRFRLEPQTAGRRVFGATFDDLTRFEIAWGADLLNKEITREGIVRGEAGGEFLVMGAEIYPVDTLRAFTRDLIRIARESTSEKTTEEPTASPASANPDQAE